MLIIFDLDDTLIETTKCLTPYVLKRAYDAMGIDADFSDLMAINQTALSARFALRDFSEKHGGDRSGLQAGIKTLFTSFDDNILIECVPGALKLLDSLAENHTLALCTIGNEALQLEKLKKAGIQTGRFSKLFVGLGPSKKMAYQMILDELGFHPSDAIVCGDRVSIDLVPAKELGLYTVHFRNGRGLFHTEPKECVDKTITQLTELHEVFAKHEG